MPQVFPQNHDPDGESSVTGLVHSVESCGTVDGPGIRFVLFLSGCSLRCRYCHNPDTSYVRRGRLRSAGDVLREIARYRDFLQAAGGGVTLSGGDPLFQPDFTGAVLKGCRKLGLHTCLDTSGHLGVNAGEEMLADTDLVLLDIKAWNPERYRSLTGGELRPTLEFAERLASLRKPVWLRYVLVPGVTDNLEEIEGLSRHAALLGNVERVDVLPFHQMGRFKWDELKLDYTLKDVPEAPAELAEQVRGLARARGVSTDAPRTGEEEPGGGPMARARQRLEGFRAAAAPGGGDLGREFLAAQLDVHPALVEMYQTQASHTTDRELGRFAITSLVGLQEDFAAAARLGERHGLRRPDRLLANPPQYGPGAGPPR